MTKSRGGLAVNVPTKKIEYWNLFMRFSPLFVSLSLFLATVSSVGYSQNTDDQISVKAQNFMDKAALAVQNQQWNQAIDLYETALALHPRNSKAYIALAEIATQQNLSGKAITLYKEVLEISPNNQTALIQQGQLFAQKGAIERAQANLSRLKILCGIDCANNQNLKIAIAQASNKGEILASEINVTPKSESQN